VSPVPTGRRGHRRQAVDGELVTALEPRALRKFFIVETPADNVRE
jgi:hypothetical protein